MADIPSDLQNRPVTGRQESPYFQNEIYRRPMPPVERPATIETPPRTAQPTPGELPVPIYEQHTPPREAVERFNHYQDPSRFDNPFEHLNRAHYLVRNHGVEFARRDYELAINAADHIDQRQVDKDKADNTSRISQIDQQLASMTRAGYPPYAMQNLAQERESLANYERRLHVLYLSPALTRANAGLALIRSGVEENVQLGKKLLVKALELRPEIELDENFQKHLKDAYRVCTLRRHQSSNPSQLPDLADLQNPEPATTDQPRALPSTGTTPGSKSIEPAAPINAPEVDSKGSYLQQVEVPSKSSSEKSDNTNSTNSGESGEPNTLDTVSLFLIRHISRSLGFAYLAAALHGIGRSAYQRMLGGERQSATAEPERQAQDETTKGGGKEKSAEESAKAETEAKKSTETARKSPAEPAKAEAEAKKSTETARKSPDAPAKAEAEAKQSTETARKSPDEPAKAEAEAKQSTETARKSPDEPAKAEAEAKQSTEETTKTSAEETAKKEEDKTAEKAAEKGSSAAEESIQLDDLMSHLAEHEAAEKAAAAKRQAALEAKYPAGTEVKVPHETGGFSTLGWQNGRLVARRIDMSKAPPYAMSSHPTEQSLAENYVEVACLKGKRPGHRYFMQKGNELFGGSIYESSGGPGLKIWRLSPEFDSIAPKDLATRQASPDALPAEVRNKHKGEVAPDELVEFKFQTGDTMKLTRAQAAEAQKAMEEHLGTNMEKAVELLKKKAEDPSLDDSTRSEVKKLLDRVEKAAKEGNHADLAEIKQEFRQQLGEKLGLGRELVAEGKPGEVTAGKGKAPRAFGKYLAIGVLADVLFSWWVNSREKPGGNQDDPGPQLNGGAP